MTMKARNLINTILTVLIALPLLLNAGNPDRVHGDGGGLRGAQELPAREWPGGAVRGPPVVSSDRLARRALCPWRILQIGVRLAGPSHRRSSCPSVRRTKSPRFSRARDLLRRPARRRRTGPYARHHRCRPECRRYRRGRVSGTFTSRRCALLRFGSLSRLPWWRGGGAAAG